MMAVLLSHDDVEMLLRELAGRLHTDGVTAGIRIVGGAAITLMNADRRSTADDLSHSLAAKGLAGATIKGSLIALSACLDDAVRGRLLTANPARGVTVPESARRTAEVVPPTTEQVRALLAELEGPTSNDSSHSSWGPGVGSVKPSRCAGPTSTSTAALWRIRGTTTLTGSGSTVVGKRTKSGGARRVALSPLVVAQLA